MRTDNVYRELGRRRPMASSAEHTNGVWAGAVDPVMIDAATTAATASRLSPAFSLASRAP